MGGCSLKKAVGGGGEIHPTLGDAQTQTSGGDRPNQWGGGCSIITSLGEKKLAHPGIKDVIFFKGGHLSPLIFLNDFCGIF